MSAIDLPILVAEDEESDAFVLKLACERAAVENRLMIVADGQEAVDYLSGKGQYADRSTHPLPGLVVLDLKMPRMTGFDVLAWVGSQPALSDMPVVVLSSSPAENDIATARRLGAREYFIKPHHIRELVEIARQFKSRWLNDTPVTEAPRDGGRTAPRF
jgi:DNA-binding response OmpR family regulator